MNYAIAFLGLIFFAATIYWFVSGKKHYTGPIVEAEVADSSSEDLRHSSSDEAGPDGVKNSKI